MGWGAFEDQLLYLHDSYCIVGICLPQLKFPAHLDGGSKRESRCLENLKAEQTRILLIAIVSASSRQKLTCWEAGPPSKSPGPRMMTIKSE